VFTRLTRRDLFSQAMAALATVPLIGQSEAQKNTQELPYYVDLPANASLWGYVCFAGDRAVEVFIAGRNTTTVTGRFDGKRLQEFEYKNPKKIAQRVSITARRVGEDNLLTYTQFAFMGDGNPMVSYGVRPLPQEATRRDGVYTYETIVMAFTNYE
jgi:hypothetical protein